jgi:hypothetical protein
MNARLLSVLAVVALCATTPVLANEGEDQPMLAMQPGYVLTNEAQQTADGGDYVVTNSNT